MGATLRIRLLGELDLRMDDRSPVVLGSARAESLLAYLLLHRGTPLPRQRLAFLLWPDSTEAQARTNLRHLLHTLRRALPDADAFLAVTAETLRWRENGPYWLDVAAFESCLARAEGGSADDALPALREAAAIYRRDLLEGRYDEWLVPEREHLRSRHREVLERLVDLCAAAGDHAEAIRHAERLVQWDPLREEPYRVLMRLHDANGDHAQALRVYHACADTLEREFGVAPSAATRHAYEALLPVDDGPTGAAPSRQQDTRRRPLVGRAAERAHLTTLWRTASGGASHLVLVTGEPGVGKTRLAEEFRSWCAHRGAATAEATSYRAEGELVFGPVVAWLRSDVLAAGLESLDPTLLAEVSRLLPELRSDHPGLPQPTVGSDAEQRQVLFRALADATVASGRQLLLLADDLHWADRDTLQFLHYLLREHPRARLLVLATARREDMASDHPLDDLLTAVQQLGRAAELPLDRLSRGETALLAANELGHPLDETRVTRLYAETEGNALFVVEALRAGWTGDENELATMTPRVQAVIQARLRQLSRPARDLLGLAATVGRAFTVDVVAAAGQAPAEQVVRALDELWSRRLIREQGTHAYDFSHDRIREVAYLALSPAQRRHHHRRVAEVLERVARDDPTAVAAQLAAHYDHAGELQQAIPWYHQAATGAQGMQAHGEAIRLLQRGLELVRDLPATPQHRTEELALVTALQAPLAAVEGYGSAWLEEVLQRGLWLAEELEVEPQPPLLSSLAITRLSQGDFDGATRAGERLRQAGRRDWDEMHRVQAEYVLGIAAFWKADFARARQHFEAAVNGYQPEQVRIHLLRFGLDPKVVCLSRLGNTLWFLGQPAAATRACDDALTLADELDHAHSRGTALVFAALLALELRDQGRLRKHTAALAADVTRQSRPNQVMSDAYGGYVDVLDGHHRHGVARIRHALDDLTGAEHAPGVHGNIVRLLVEACVTAGDFQGGLAAAETLLRLGGAAVVWEPEAHRLAGRSLAELGASPEDIEGHLEAALRAARHQQARSFELRAATSLLQFHLDRGNDDQVAHARALLAAIVTALPEPIETADVHDAVSLLEER